MQGISIRNLFITPSRVRGKTIDDDDIPNTLKSPAKLLAQAESRTRLQSRSYVDLKLSLAERPSINGTSSENEGKVHNPRRNRRRSTLPWSGGNLESRQAKLEDITKTRMANTWFSIHCNGIDRPIYVSEIAEKATNPDFRFFDLKVWGPPVSRLDEMILRLWVKSENMAEYVLLVELRLSLKSLQYVGQTLESFHQPLPPNCILFHFPDGIYTNLTDLPPAQSPLFMVEGGHSRQDVQSTSSYDALMRLANLDDCIQDALVTREKLETQINAILEKNNTDLQTTGQVSQAREKVSVIKRGVLAEKKQLRASIKRKEDLIASIKARRDAMALGRETQDKARSHLPDARLKMTSSASLLEKNSEEDKGQIRRICEDLLTIYPIEPIPGKALAFTIAGLPLPNSSFENIDRDVVAAALGCTAHLVYLLSYYLSVPIPYPVKPYLSSSVIQDPISMGLPQRLFPLYPINVQYRFEYAVFLLNKDIEFLMNRSGLRVLDIRHTLPNLKYLLYVLTAGTSDLPVRKAGGVRGLLMERRTPTLSRQGSQDSIASGEMIPPRRVGDILSKAAPTTNDSDHSRKPPPDFVPVFVTPSVSS